MVFDARTEQQIICWGNAIPVQSGLFSNGVVILPDLIPSNAIQIAGCLDGGLILNKDGTLQGWGGGAREGLSNIVSIAAWESFYIAVNKSGKAFYWEGGTRPRELEGIKAITRGALTLTIKGTVADLNGLVELSTESLSLKSIAVGGKMKQHRIGLKKDGRLCEWTTGGEIRELMFPPVWNEIVAVKAAPRHYLALRKDGTVIQWGQGGVSNATAIFSNAQVAIDGRVLTNVVAIAAGGNEVPPLNEFSLALHMDGTVIGWGTLGWKPLAIPASLSNVVAIAAADTYCMAVQEIK